jgi:hypothetical protein
MTDGRPQKRRARLWSDLRLPRLRMKRSRMGNSRRTYAANMLACGDLDCRLYAPRSISSFSKDVIRTVQNCLQFAAGDAVGVRKKTCLIVFIRQDSAYRRVGTTGAVHPIGTVPQFPLKPKLFLSPSFLFPKVPLTAGAKQAKYWAVCAASPHPS